MESFFSSVTFPAAFLFLLLATCTVFSRAQAQTASSDLRNILPLTDLPQRIAYKPGEVSLVADPVQREFGVTVYLINDTDESIVGLSIGDRNPEGLVRVGGNWFSRKVSLGDCFSPGRRADLPARSALALSGPRSDSGDIGGDVCYAFTTPVKTILSEPTRGRYFQNEVEQTLASGYLTDTFSRILERGVFENHWKPTEGARNIEEFCALLEIMRCFELRLEARARLSDWMMERVEEQDATDEQAAAIQVMKKVLAKAWLNGNDGQSLADRCIAALETASPASYGTPEKCKAAVWRFLSTDVLHGEMMFAWHDGKSADAASVARLVELAKTAVNTGDNDTADAAAGFLAENSTESQFPAQGFFIFLESGRLERIHWGIKGIAKRGRLAEAVHWLLGRMETDDPETLEYYAMILPELSGPQEAWEGKVLNQVFSSKPLETLRVLSGYPQGNIARNLPPESEPRLRTFLKHQFSASRRQWWHEAAERSMKKRLSSPDEVQDSVEGRDCLGLHSGISMLAALKNPDDEVLLKEFLDHPAALFIVKPDQSGTLSYIARDAAKSALSNRGVPVSESIVSYLDYPKPAMLRITDFMKSAKLSTKALLVAGAVFILTVLVITLRRLRMVILSK